MNLARCVETLNVLADESRLRLCALLRERELCVTDLVRVTGLAQSRVSTHLGRLREAGFVRDRREGQQAFYALDLEALPTAVKGVLDDALASPDPTLVDDRKRLKKLEAERRYGLPESFAGEMERHYSPGRTWQSLAQGLAALLDLGDVLDVGSGDGAAASVFAPWCRSLTCIDQSERMIDAAKERFAKLPHVRALVADAQELPFEPASFDALVLFHTLGHVDKPKRTIEECARVLRPGGRLVLLALDEHAHQDITAAYGERHAGFSPRVLRGLLTRAGLSVAVCDVAGRESKKPHFQVVRAVAHKPAARPTRTKKAG
jgi:SAM-dependent methyltransferase